MILPPNKNYADKQRYFMNLIQELTKLIETNLNSPLSMKQISTLTGYTERWLYTKFKTEVGMSVAQYIRRRKLTLAAVLLRHTSRPITDIAIMYEFSSLQNFSRAFTNQYKISPLQYRKSTVWDMQYGQPILYNLKDNVESQIIEISIGRHLTLSMKKIPIRLGIDYIYKSQRNHFRFNDNLYKAIIAIMDSTTNMKEFVISGELIPGVRTDSELVHMVEPINNFDDVEVWAPKGFYISLFFRGTFEEIANFKMYDSYNVFYRAKYKLRKGAVITLFKQTAHKNIYDIHELTPCEKYDSTVTAPSECNSDSDLH